MWELVGFAPGIEHKWATGADDGDILGINILRCGSVMMSTHPFYNFLIIEGFIFSWANQPNAICKPHL